MNDTNNHLRTTGSLVQSNGNASGLLEGLEGKGPHDILDALPPSRLSRAMIEATVGSLILLVALTVVPYVLSKNSDTPTAAKKENPEDKKVEPKPADDAKPSDKAPPVEVKKDDAKPAKDAVDRLKENDVKKDKPKEPLGPSIDDLIDKK